MRFYEVTRQQSNRINAMLSKILGAINFTHFYNQKGGMFKLPTGVDHEVIVDPNDMKDAADLLMKDDGDAGFLFKQGKLRLVPAEKAPMEEITVEDTQDFHEEFGELGYSIDEADMFEAEYRGRKVKLNKPMRGDVKKFKVYVKNKKGNVIKVNFGDPNMRIKKSNPARRRSFRARHNCDNPGPKTKARYWSCRKW